MSWKGITNLENYVKRARSMRVMTKRIGGGYNKEEGIDITSRSYLATKIQ